MIPVLHLWRFLLWVKLLLDVLKKGARNTLGHKWLRSYLRLNLMKTTDWHRCSTISIKRYENCA